LVFIQNEIIYAKYQNQYTHQNPYYIIFLFHLVYKLLYTKYAVMYKNL
jgi:hypothetical protein